ncbi:hypothetical protein Tco_0373287, partial [Tanacetum coccineum]
PLSYPMFFPNGEAGWHKRIPRTGVDIRELIDDDDDDDDDGVEDEEAHKLANPDHYDKVVCAEIPVPNKHKDLHQLVLKHMIHGPCEPKKCRWNYPRQFQETTRQRDDSYPLYRWRDNGIEVDIRNSESLSEDYNLDCASVERVQNMVLTDVSSILQSMGRSLSDFDLLNITADGRSYAFGCREVHKECSIVVQEEDILARHSINTDQKNAYDTIMRHVDADSPGVFLLMALEELGKRSCIKLC